MPPGRPAKTKQPEGNLPPQFGKTIFNIEFPKSSMLDMLSEFNVEWGVIMATGMLLAIPPIIFTLFASRQIITGMTAGAVKG